MDGSPTEKRENWVDTAKSACGKVSGSCDLVRGGLGATRTLPVVMFRDLRVMQFLLIYTLIQISTYGAVFYLPAEISALLHKSVGIEVGLVSAEGIQLKNNTASSLIRATSNYSNNYVV